LISNSCTMNPATPSTELAHDKPCDPLYRGWGATQSLLLKCQEPQIQRKLEEEGKISWRHPAVVLPRGWWWYCRCGWSFLRLSNTDSRDYTDTFDLNSLDRWQTGHRELSRWPQQTQVHRKGDVHDGRDADLHQWTRKRSSIQSMCRRWHGSVVAGSTPCRNDSNTRPRSLGTNQQCEEQIPRSVGSGKALECMRFAHFTVVDRPPSNQGPWLKIWSGRSYDQRLSSTNCRLLIDFIVLSA